MIIVTVIFIVIVTVAVAVETRHCLVSTIQSTTNQPTIPTQPTTIPTIFNRSN